MKRSIVLILFFLTFPQAALAMNQPKKNALRKHQRKLNSDLRKAVEQGGINKIEDLLKAGANPNTTFKGDKTPLHVAAEGRYNACSLLLKYGAHVNAQDNCGMTPLISATRSDTEEICRLLLEHKAQINAQTPSGLTALMHATSYYCNNLSVRKILLAHGADLRIKDNHDKTALSISIPFFHESRILISHSRFYPHYSPDELHNAQQRTRTRLWIMKLLCPTLPKDIKELILKLDSETWQDTCCTPLKMHSKKNDRIILMPLPILRIFSNQALLKEDAFDSKQIVTLLARYKMEQLTPLMLHALKKCLTLNAATRNLREMLDPSRLEEQFGDEIRNNIKTEVLPEHSGRFSECNIQ